MDFDECLEEAHQFGIKQYPEASAYKHAAFANSVVYLITGWSGGYGGPSLRQHAVTWMAVLQGDGMEGSAILGLQSFLPDARYPRPGEWQFEAACAFAGPIVYGELSENEGLRNLLIKISEREYHYGDDSEDLEALRQG